MKRVLLEFGFSGQTHSVSYSSSVFNSFCTCLLLQPFPITNGTRQGCPLSPSIFNLTIVSLAETIRSHAFITGFHFKNCSHVINLFPGGVILLLTYPKESSSHAHQVLIWFSSVSYYKLNYTKSLIVYLVVSKPTRAHLMHTYFTPGRTIVFLI